MGNIYKGQERCSETETKLWDPIFKLKLTSSWSLTTLAWAFDSAVSSTSICCLCSDRVALWADSSISIRWLLIIKSWSRIQENHKLLHDTNKNINIQNGSSNTTVIKILCIFRLKVKLRNYSWSRRNTLLATILFKSGLDWIWLSGHVLVKSNFKRKKLSLTFLREFWQMYNF